MLVVDIKLKNNRGKLNCGVIFKENKRGEDSIQDKEQIEKILEQSKVIYFQNGCMNATISKKLIESYSIKEIDKNEF